MANIHERIVDHVMTDWSVQNRGRLFKNHSGAFKLDSGAYIKYGLRSKNLTLPDLVGFEMIDNYPVFCVVEVKTLAYNKLSKSQIDSMNMVIDFGGRAYIARQIEGEKYYLIEHGF